MITLSLRSIKLASIYLIFAFSSISLAEKTFILKDANSEEHIFHLTKKREYVELESSNIWSPFDDVIDLVIDGKEEKINRVKSSGVQVFRSKLSEEEEKEWTDLGVVADCPDGHSVNFSFDLPGKKFLYLCASPSFSISEGFSGNFGLIDINGFSKQISSSEFQNVSTFLQLEKTILHGYRGGVSTFYIVNDEKLEKLYQTTDNPESYRPCKSWEKLALIERRDNMAVILCGSNYAIVDVESKEIKSGVFNLEGSLLGQTAKIVQVEDKTYVIIAVGHGEGASVNQGTNTHIELYLFEIKNDKIMDPQHMTVANVDFNTYHMAFVERKDQAYILDLFLNGFPWWFVGDKDLKVVPGINIGNFERETYQALQTNIEGVNIQASGIKTVGNGTLFFRKYQKIKSNNSTTYLSSPTYVEYKSADQKYHMDVVIPGDLGLSLPFHLEENSKVKKFFRIGTIIFSTLN